MKKIFGGIDLTWKKIIVSAILIGIYTAVIASISIFKYTSLHAVTTTFEVWVLVGILIIMNSKSNKDAALKCFVFFLISQPLVYLLQVPFSYQGWGLFGYYKYWFIWTILCIPMGYIGYYMKKDKWWGYLILLPMIILVGYSYSIYLSDFMFSYPRYIFIVLFCIATMIIYPLYIFKNKKIRIVGVIISSLIIIGVTIICLLNPPKYVSQLSLSNYGYEFNDEYKVYLLDKKYGSAKIVYEEAIDYYLVQAEFKKAGKVTMVVESPDGVIDKYLITVERDTYKIEKK